MNRFSQIETKRLLLKQLETSDWKEVSFLRSDKKVNEFVKRPSANTKEKALDFISKINTGIDHGNLFYWKIVEKHQNKMIGSICLWNFSEDKKVAEIGYDLNPKFQGQGYMSESLKKVLNFGFLDLNLNSIEAYTHKKNNNSTKLLERHKFNLVIEKQDKDNAENSIYELKKTTYIDR